MKLKLIAAMCCMLPVMVGCKTQTGNSSEYNLTVYLKGVPEQSTFQLIPVSHESEKALIDTVMTGGKLSLSGSVETPRAVWLVVDGAFYGKPLMLENKKVSIVGDVVSVGEDDNKRTQITSLNIAGSQVTDKKNSLERIRGRMDSN